VGVAVLVLGTFVCVEGLAMKFAHQSKRVSVTGALPDTFPVIVDCATGATVVRARGLDTFLQSHPGSTLVLQDERLAEVRNSLRQQVARSRADSSRPEPDLHFVYCHFEVQSSLEGRQRITVSAAADEDWENEAVYEPSQAAVNPVSHTTYFGPGQVILTAPISALVTAILWLPVLLIVRRRRASVAPAAN
jgi:hypothetical protein